MSEDWFVAAVRRVSDAGRAACESVEAAVHALEAGREARLAGRPASEIVDELISGGGRDVRLGAAGHFASSSGRSNRCGWGLSGP